MYKGCTNLKKQAKRNKSEHWYWSQSSAWINERLKENSWLSNW